MGCFVCDQWSALDVQAGSLSISGAENPQDDVASHRYQQQSSHDTTVVIIQTESLKKNPPLLC